MKNLFCFFLTVLFLNIIINESKAGIAPTFTMTVKNISNIANGNQDSIATFEVWLQQTNQGQTGVDDLEYGAGQYTFRYNKAVHTPGGNLILNLNSTGNDLPASLRPPTFQVDSVNGYLKGSGNLPQSLTNWYAPGTFPGAKILTFRMRTNARCFHLQPINLSFKLGPAPNTFIAYMLPYADTVDSESFPNQFAVALMDTVANVYSVENGGFVYPVEMSTFVSLINSNNVTLNWTTTSETNNSGFEIERSEVKSQASNVWIKVGTVNGNGTSTEPHNYSYTDSRVSTGHYSYRLKQIDFNGTENYHFLNRDVIVGIPTSYSMSQNYPNPFNPSTKIDFELPYDGKVSIQIYDVSGREISKIVNDIKTAGYYSVQFNAAGLSSGMYFYRINAEGNGQNFSVTKKMLLLK